MESFFINKQWSLRLVVLLACLSYCSGARAQQGLTIYNQEFGVVRQILPLELREGENPVQVNNITRFLEPNSVVLRDPEDKSRLQVLEQNYRADAVTLGKMLLQYEGKTLDFLVEKEGRQEIVKAKIIRSGYTPSTENSGTTGGYYVSDGRYYIPNTRPVVEVDGAVRFSWPGVPLFPVLADDSILKPELHWLVKSNKPGPVDAELAYITGGLSWEADYNFVAPETGDIVELSGWVTMTNASGNTFDNARIRLMAGDISKILKAREQQHGVIFTHFSIGAREGDEPPVTEKSFDEYHLYTLSRPATLHDGETKQVEFVHAKGIATTRLYVYDGMMIEDRYAHNDPVSYRFEREYGQMWNSKVAVFREFANTTANGLGIPLPKGKVRFYRKDGGEAASLEFTGENVIDHTPTGEKLRFYTGDAFDLVGARRQTSFKRDDSGERWAEESFEIKLRSHKKEPVEVRVMEHLNRGANWQITQKSNAYLKLDAHTIEFRIQLAPEEEKTITYAAHYAW